MDRVTGLGIKSENFLITMLLLLLPIGQVLGQQDDRYSFNYPGSFFREGGREVEFNASAHRKIGVLASNRTIRSLSEITRMIFKSSPFDRYKQFFYFRIEQEFREDLASNNIFSTRAYDYDGRAIEGGLSVSEGRGSFNLTFLRFGKQEVIQCSCSGVTIHTDQGNFSFAGEDSILHEIGHAFAELADEYSHPRASNFAAVNLEDRGVHRPKWNRLTRQGFLPNRRIEREETVNGFDRGRFLIPSNNCYMNNHRNPGDDRYCPVCQLAIIDRISQLSRATSPWK